jgi:hypothetical protein
LWQLNQIKEQFGTAVIGLKDVLASGEILQKHAAVRNKLSSIKATRKKKYLPFKVAEFTRKKNIHFYRKEHFESLCCSSQLFSTTLTESKVLFPRFTYRSE